MTNNVPQTPVQKELENYSQQLSNIAEDGGNYSKDPDGSVTCWFKGLNQFKKAVKLRINVHIDADKGVIKAQYSVTGKDDRTMDPAAAIKQIIEDKNSILSEPTEPIGFD